VLLVECFGTIATVRESVSTASILGKVPIFSGLAENELDFLAQRVVRRHYSAGEIVFSEGEPRSGLYVVESGQLRILPAHQCSVPARVRRPSF
jgi:signal-transduction protein with cAMP-binding, CBS, and nucleotidyltransferase domain